MERAAIIYEYIVILFYDNGVKSAFLNKVQSGDVQIVQRPEIDRDRKPDRQERDHETDPCRDVRPVKTLGRL